MTIQLLREDLSALLAFASLSPEMLACDHPKTLRLHSEDGRDGRPVGSLSRDKIKRFMKGLGEPPPSCDLVRLGIFTNIGPYRTVQIVLKAEWEKFCAREMGQTSGSPTDLERLLRDEALARRKRDQFNPNTSAIFQLFEEHGQLASSIEYTPKTFDTLIQELILNDLHLAANTSPELEAFTQRALDQQAMMRNATEEEREEFSLLKYEWMELQEELGEILHTLESRRLQNAKVSHRWLVIFGEAYFGLQEQLCRLEALEIRIELKKANPHLTKEDLDQLVAERERERRKKLDAERKLAALTAVPDPHRPVVVLRPFGNEHLVDEKNLADYRQKCKKTLVELRLLLHPDRLELNPVYERLTEKQKAFLEELGRRVLEIKPHELVSPSAFRGYELRSLESLRDALEEAKSVIENAGLAVNVRLIIKGETLIEQMNWLRQSNKNLETEIECARAELRVEMEDPEIGDKRAILARPTEYEDIKNEILQRTEDRRRQADSLEREYAALFETEEDP